jgi:hypothetical protein
MIMEDNEIAEYKEKSKSMFNDVCDSASLININLEALTMETIIRRFLSTKASKTDFGVLIGLLDFWEKETSVIYIESYSIFRSITKSSLANANLSRALRSLEEHKFIRRVGSHNRLEYFFDIPFNILHLEFSQYADKCR